MNLQNKTIEELKQLGFDTYKRFHTAQQAQEEAAKLLNAIHQEIMKKEKEKESAKTKEG